MNIVNICLAGPFSDGWNYQENLLTKYQSKNGNKVSILTSKWIWNNKGKLECINKSEYINDDNVRIIRLPMKHKENIKNRFKRFKGLYDSLNSIKPDIIFIHGCQFLDISTIVKYAKKNKVIIYIDNHADFSNSATNFLSLNILHKIIWRYYANLIEPYVKKFYGVLPARVDFLKDIYKIPKNKVELLLMGADDELVDKYNKKKNKKESIVDSVSDDDFLIVTGGKIDKAKTQILNLMEVVNKCKKSVKLLIFGSVDDELKERFNALLSEKIIYIGWINSNDTYKYIQLADLVVYPGRHSVLWEQTVAQGKPMVVKYWEGTTHIDIGGNVLFLKNDNKSTLEEIITNIINNRDNIYTNMLKIASSNKKKKFFYSEIAKKSIK